jgi:mono/diheme cytochrome c family protein
MRIRGGAFALLAAGLIACGGDEHSGNGNGDGNGGNGNGAIDPEVAAILALDGDVATGEAEFGLACGNPLCHGEDGVSGPGGDLATIVPASTDVELVSVMLDGAGRMPSQASLGDQTLADILAYLRAEFR